MTDKENMKELHEVLSKQKEDILEAVSSIDKRYQALYDQLKDGQHHLQADVKDIRHGLTEDISCLRHELELTRRDLKEYNNLRAQIAELDSKTHSINERCHFNMTSEGGFFHRIELRLDEIEKSIKGRMGYETGRKDSSENLFKWTGWIVGILGVIITILAFVFEWIPIPF